MNSHCHNRHFLNRPPCGNKIGSRTRASLRPAGNFGLRGLRGRPMKSENQGASRPDPVCQTGCHPVCQAFFGYWDGLRRPDELIPARRRFLPEEVPKLLESFILVELVSDDEILTRLAGSKVVQDFGFDPKGVNYLDFVHPDRRQIASMNIWTTHRQPCGVWALTEQRYPEQKTVQSEMLGLPLAGGENSGPQVLFLRHAVSQPKFMVPAKVPGPMNHILDLKFIDIGAGVPDGPLPPAP